ncbi:MAG: family 20 glycosylhydrolase [bacterium]|nr:family 20 glycosylhydrolase [bacterium]
MGHDQTVDAGAGLLPHPKQVATTPGSCSLADLSEFRLVGSSEPAEREAAQRFCTICSDHLDLAVPLICGDAVDGSGRIVARIADASGSQALLPGEASDPDRAAQGYTLRITPDGIELVAASAAGLFYGLQTLGQLPGLFGRVWPGMEICDLPDFAIRGVSHDVTRGKVPTLATLKELADRLASWKVNQLQLYVEHTFAFVFNPNISRGCDPLTPDEIRELDAYCTLRRIELVPSLASCGHMGRILSLPEYRHLAEIETSEEWGRMSWRRRMHGLTLDVRSPESRSLLEAMYDEYLPLFSCDKVNVCCDETYDLGRGKNRERAERDGIGQLYLEHLCWLAELCRRHGKRMMFWGDIIRKYPELIHRVPAEAIVLNWDYRTDADYDSTGLFCRAGRATYVCPGTSSWNQVINDVNAAELNIRGHAAAGLKHGAVGLLNTDWGDDGHFNLLAGSWHPLALGAAVGWNAAAPPAAGFDRAFGQRFFGPGGHCLVRTLHKVAATSDLRRSWPSLYAPLTETHTEQPFTDRVLQRRRLVSLAAAGRFERPRSAGSSTRQDLHELEIACRMNALVAEKLAVVQRLSIADGHVDPQIADQLLRFADRCEKLAPPYKAAWLGRNRRAGLDDIMAVFARLTNEARALAAGEPTDAPFDAEQHYRERLEVFVGEDVEPGGVVLVGSSHVEHFDTARLLPGRRIVNRGIAADRIGITDRGILHRLEASVFDCRPAAVLLENGANDLGELWRTGAPSIDVIAACFQQVVTTVRRRLPQVPMCIVSVLPTTRDYAGMSPLVRPLNRHVERIAGEHDCHYMNFYGDVVDTADLLRGDLTDDGLHLNERGYRMWADRIGAWLDGG